MIYNLSGITPKRVFFTADTHFFHPGIINHARRPFKSVEEMNDILIRKWNATIPKDGIVFHLGDFCFGDESNWEGCLDRLNGTICLVAGNHDLIYVKKKDIFSRFSAVELEMIISIDGQSILLNHYPLLCYGGHRSRIWQLFGHIHTTQYGSEILSKKQLSKLLPTQYDVGVDNNGFTPVSFERIHHIIRWQDSTGERFQM